MKAHGIATNGSSARSTSGPTGSKRDNTASSKKRKLDQFGGDQGSYPVDDDDEGNCKVKNELEVEGVKESIIKAEEDLVVDAVQDSPIPDSGMCNLESTGPIWALTEQELFRSDQHQTLVLQRSTVRLSWVSPLTTPALKARLSRHPPTKHRSSTTAS